MEKINSIPSSQGTVLLKRATHRCRRSQGLPCVAPKLTYQRIQQSWWCLKENLVKERQKTVDKRYKNYVRRGGEGGESASGSGAEPPLQPLEKSCWNRQIFTLQPVGDSMLELWIFP